jgi:hypothetical protein
LPNPRNVHVLFVHGVGSHSRLSSLLQAYQALRGNPTHPETAIEYEDLNPEWRLEVFDDTAGIPYIKLSLPGAPRGTPGAVYLYEVNYSALAGVVRANHPLDVTGLFAGFDLAVNVARSRLDHPDPSLALTVQRLAGVFVAATVPILGIPSLIFRSYTHTLVATFTRFFEDIATFALDTSGEQLISAHVERTIETILDSPRFSQAGAGHERDVLVIAAHSLGTVVIHNHIARESARGRGRLPSRLLTYGSPIGLVCWMWLFLDFLGMDFNRPNLDHPQYFTPWTPFRDQAESPLPPPIQWINVVNHLDPIATAFPLAYVNLARTADANARSLVGRRVHHRFIRAGKSAGSAHNAYFEDREGFLEILSRLAGLRAGPAEAVLDPQAQAREGAPAPRNAGRHWKEGVEALDRLSTLWWLSGLAAIALYLASMALAFANWWLMLFMLLFASPQLTMGTLAFCQRFICGKPTKRVSGEAIGSLPWGRLSSFPYRLRHALRRAQTEAQERAEVLSARMRLRSKLLMWLVSFAPPLGAMLLPLAALWLAGGLQAPHPVFTQYWALVLPALLALFTFYLIAFAISEFVAKWRELVVKTTGPGLAA